MTVVRFELKMVDNLKKKTKIVHKKYLICCCSNNADREGEYKGYGACEDEGPPWKLHLVSKNCAKKQRHNKARYQ
jgi:hypothetical protein